MSHDLDADDHELRDEGLLLSFSSNNILSPLVSHSCAGHTLKGCQEEVAVTKFGCPIKVVRFKAMQSLP